MKKIRPIVLLNLILSFGVFAQTSLPFSISGKVNKPQSNWIFLCKVLNGNNLQHIDSVKIDKENGFAFKGKIPPGGGYYVLDFYGKQQVLLLLEGNDDLQITADGAEKGIVSIAGSKTMELMQRANQMYGELQKKVETWNGQMNEATQRNDKATQEKIQQEYIIARKQTTENIKALFPEMGTSLAALASVNLIVGDNPEEELPFLINLADKFEKERPKDPQSQSFVQNVRRLQGTRIGATAPEITLNDPMGKTTSLSSLRGKYVLVDFWASWCGPCRKENPTVVQAYQRFKLKNFEIFGVSLDNNTERWQQAIQADKLTWTHVSDLKGWGSPVAGAYQVQGIPANFLLDKDGKIIAKNLRGEDLLRKLEELLPN